ncbi:MAG: hypothetical protein KGI36_09990, partial [Burkholderiales bacterium]|nr:hypothetical protein [Burkholderiales bacterium]
MKLFRSDPRGLAGLLLSLFASACLAQDPPHAEGQGLRLSGFGTAGLTHTVAPEGWGFLRGIDQGSNSGGTQFATDSRLGLQVNYAVDSHFEAVGQFMLASRSDYDKNSDAIEWLFGAYRPNAHLTLRAGRLNTDNFLMSDYRNVGFAYPFLRPPVEYYGSIPTALDGIDVTRTWDDGDNQWRAKVMVGSVKVSGVTLSPGYGGSLTHEGDGLTLRAGIQRARFRNVSPGLQQLLDGLGQFSAGLALLPPQAAPIAGPRAAEARALAASVDYNHTTLTYGTLGAAYDTGTWQIQAELTHVVGGPTSSFKSGYLSIGRNIGSVTVFGIASAATSHRAPTSEPAWGPALLQLGLPAASAQQAQMLGDAGYMAATLLIAQRTLS